MQGQARANPLPIALWVRGRLGLKISRFFGTGRAASNDGAVETWNLFEKPVSFLLAHDCTQVPRASGGGGVKEGEKILPEYFYCHVLTTDNEISEHTLV